MRNLGMRDSCTSLFNERYRVSFSNSTAEYVVFRDSWLATDQDVDIRRRSQNALVAGMVRTLSARA